MNYSIKLFLFAFSFGGVGDLHHNICKSQAVGVWILIYCSAKLQHKTESVITKKQLLSINDKDITETGSYIRFS